MPSHAAIHHEATLPPPDQLDRSDFDLVLRRLADDLAFGADNSLFVGSGLEYAGSRPYQRGDSVRLLNWRLTARTGKPFVREYEALKRSCLYIVLDTSSSMGVSSTALTKHDIGVWVAAGIGLVGQRRMSPVAIVGAGERTSRVVPSLRRADLWRTLEPLRARPVGEQTRLADRLNDLSARATRASLFVVISDLHDPDAVGAIRRASQRHDCMVIHTQDPTECEPLRAGFMRAREAETGREFLASAGSRWGESPELHADLLRCGVDRLRLRTDKPFIAPLRRFLAERGGLTRGHR